MSKSTSSFLLAACLATVGPTTHAQSANGIWQFDGYGTLGVAHSSEHDADYIPNSANTEGPGRTHHWDAELDSRLAFQLTALPDSRFSAVIQVIAERQFDTDFKLGVEWANLKYDVNPGLSLRAGRIALGTFMVSDHRKVGYALPWIRPPAELYAIVPITNSDGMDISFNTRLGSYNYTAEINYGRNKLDETDGIIEAPNLWGFSNRLESEALTLHASYLAIKLNFDATEPLWEAYRQFGSGGQAVARAYDSGGDWVSFTAAGFSYDPGDWFVMGEWGRGRAETDFGAGSGWYVSGGYRRGAFTPYLGYARAKGGHRSVNGLDPTPFPAAVQAGIRNLNAMLAGIQRGFGVRQETVTAGARWDFHSSISAKLQFDHVTTRKGSIGTFRNMESGYIPDGANVVSIAVDFVF